MYPSRKKMSADSSTFHVLNSHLSGLLALPGDLLRLSLPFACVPLGKRRPGRQERLLGHLAAAKWPGSPRLIKANHRGAPVLLLEYVAGQPLEQRYQEHTLGMAAVLDVARTMAPLLRDMHARGVVHLAIRPRSVIIKPDGSLVLLDWSRARFIDDDSDSDSDDHDEGVIIDCGDGDASERPIRADRSQDVLGFGATLLYLVTGGNQTQPFPSLNRHLPDWFVRLLRAACDGDPAARPTFDQICDSYIEPPDPAVEFPTLLAEQSQKHESLPPLTARVSPRLRLGSKFHPTAVAAAV